MLPSQKQLAASICMLFGEFYWAEKDYARAEQSYKEALSYSPIDNKVGGPEPGPCSFIGAVLS